MCLAIPGRVLSIEDDNPLSRLARVSFGGIVKEISLAMVPEARVGEYVLAHAGVALSAIDEEEAAETLAYMEELEKLQETTGEDTP